MAKKTFEGGCRTCQEYRTQGRPEKKDRIPVKKETIKLFVTPRKVSASTCRQFRTRRICRTGTGPQPGQKTPLEIDRIKRNPFIKKMMDELPLDINTNSPCTFQSLAYTPSCQHQQSLPSRSILAGEESSGKELVVLQVNIHK